PQPARPGAGPRHDQDPRQAAAAAARARRDQGSTSESAARPRQSMSKRFIKQLCTTTPFWRLFAGALRPQGLTVLMYHRIVAPGDAFPGTPVGQFRAQMQWLRRHCEPIAPEHFEESLLV